MTGRPATLNGSEYAARLLERMATSSLSDSLDRSGRSRWTLFIDGLLATIRRWLPPLHWLVTLLTALILLIYVRAVAWTARITIRGEGWPPTPSVLAIWHGSAPSLLAATTARSERPRSSILVSSDARGDILARLCRMLGLDVVRGDSGHDARGALRTLADQLETGGNVILTADGGGPAGVARAGPIVLAAAAGVPLVPVGADCRPALSEIHKWDTERNPLPFGRITVRFGPPMEAAFNDAAELRSRKEQLTAALNDAALRAREASLTQPASAP